MESMRKTGKEALKSVLVKEQNIKVIEKNIFDITKKYSSNDKFEGEYTANIYQVIGDIVSGVELKTILNCIKQNKIGWEHSSFENIKNKIKEQDDFIKNPFEVEEGVLECKCGSKRVYSYQRQVRSSDEPMTTFAQCMSCKSRWTYSG